MENLRQNSPSLSESYKPNGREVISTESALAVQISLAKYMAPNEIQEILNKRDNEELMDDLVARWVNSYAEKFEVFCNQYADIEMIQRIQEQNFTNDDLDRIKDFLLSSE